MIRERLTRRAEYSKAAKDWIFGIFFLLFGASYLVAGYWLPSVRLSDPVGHKVFPIIVAVLLVAVGAGSIISSLVQQTRSATGGKNDVQRAYPYAVLACAGGLLLFFILLPQFGFVLSASLFMISMTTALNRKGWVANLVVSILFPLFIYLVFSHLLGVRLVGLPFDL